MVVECEHKIKANCRNGGYIKMTSKYESLISRAKEELEFACEKLSKLYLSISSDEGLSATRKDELLSEIGEFYPSRYINQKMIGSVAANNYGASYQSSIASLIRFKKYLRGCGVVLAPGGNDKNHDKAFAEALGVPTPQRYHDSVIFNDLEIIEDSIIKPMSGSSSRNVFYIKNGCVVEVKNKKKYKNLQSVFQSFSPRLGGANHRWIQEELIVNNKKPASDIKLFCFYGKVGLILEVDRNSENNAINCFYDSMGNVVEVGQKNVKNFVGKGVEKTVIEYAEKISANSPVPFLRIDFYQA